MEAQIGLTTTESGGLLAPMPSGTHSPILVFPSLDRSGVEEWLGAVIDAADGSALAPGKDQVPVVIRFWADEAAVYATPGSTFRLWYGRTVGTGVVTRIADEAATP